MKTNRLPDGAHGGEKLRDNSSQFVQALIQDEYTFVVHAVIREA